jgi:hypothetical protein
VSHCTGERAQPEPAALPLPPPPAPRPQLPHFGPGARGPQALPPQVDAPHAGRGAICPPLPHTDVAAWTRPAGHSPYTHVRQMLSLFRSSSGSVALSSRACRSAAGALLAPPPLVVVAVVPPPAPPNVEEELRRPLVDSRTQTSRPATTTRLISSDLDVPSNLSRRS